MTTTKSMTGKRVLKRTMRCLERANINLGIKGYGKDFWNAMDRCTLRRYGNIDIAHNRNAIATYRVNP